MARLSAAEKQKRYRERLKQNTEKYEEAKRKHREHYHKVKRLVKDLSSKEKKQANLIWKLRQREYRKSRKNLQYILDETPPSTPMHHLQADVLPPSSPDSTASRERGRKKVKNDRIKVYRDNKKLQKENIKLKKICEKYKKRLMRSKQIKCIDQNEKDNETYKLLTNSIKERYNIINSNKEKRLLKSILKTDSIETSRQKTKLLRETFGINREYAKNVKTNRPKILLQKKIHQFFLRDDVSRATAGKKETLTKNGNKVQKRYLLDTMRKLHADFKKENPDLPCSYYYFTKNRPFYVISASVDARETCLCKTHANISYKAQALKKQGVLKTSDLNDIIQKTVCSDRSKDCMYNDCGICKNKKIEYVNEKIVGTIKYMEWVRKEVKYEKDGKFMKVTKNVKDEQSKDVIQLWQTFEKDIIIFKKHIYNIKIQFHSFRECLNYLQPNECAVVVDFSENYNCKYYEEVQSHHFGGSRNQVSLHTVMVYTYEPKKYAAKSFCTIAASNNHQPAAIWAHLKPILDWVRNEQTTVDTVHFFSDGPSTQYRQKQNFYLLCTKYFEYGFAATTWSFFEAGHGKGPADGIGGFLKRTADRIVASGTDLSNAEEFFNQLKNTSKIKMFLIKEEAIQQIQNELPKIIPRLIGTLKVHQIFTDKRNTLKYRWLSCFCESSRRGFCSCLSPKTYYVNFKATTQKNNVGPAKQLKPSGRNSIKNQPDQSDEDMPLAELKEIHNLPLRRSIYRAIYGSSSESDGEELHRGNKENRRPMTTTDYLFENDDAGWQLPSTSFCEIPRRVSAGDFLHVYVYGNNKKKNIYSYVCKALDSIEEDGEVKVMFLRVVSNDAKIFRIDKKDISYVNYEDIIKILPMPTTLDKERYQFEMPVDIFEK